LAVPFAFHVDSAARREGLSVKISALTAAKYFIAGLLGYLAFALAFDFFMYIGKR
jgi:hypothetical protein